MSELEVTEGQLLSQDFRAGAPVAESKKPPEILAAEIRSIKAQTEVVILSVSLNAYIEIGRRLTDIKAQLPHGKWGEFLKQEVNYSPSQAQNLMKIFREYGDDQQSLFGSKTKSQTFGNLTVSKALSLLAITDEEERERFTIENDVEHMSVRELNAALKARNEAEAAAAASQEETEKLRKENGQLQAQLDDQARGYEAKLTSAGVEVDKAKADAQAAREAEEKAAAKAQRFQDALSEANTTAQAAEEKHTRLLRELEELRNRPTDTAAVEAARKAAIEEMTEKVNKSEADMKQAVERRKAAEESLAAVQKKLDELKAKEPEVRELTQEEKDAMTAEAVNRAKAEGAEQIRNLEKKLAATDPDVAEFKVRWATWQETYGKMMEVLNRIAQANEEQAAKLRNAVKAALEQMT